MRRHRQLEGTRQGRNKLPVSIGTGTISLSGFAVLRAIYHRARVRIFKNRVESPRMSASLGPIAARAWIYQSCSLFVCSYATLLRVRGWPGAADVRQLHANGLFTRESDSRDFTATDLCDHFAEKNADISLSATPPKEPTHLQTA